MGFPQLRPVVAYAPPITPLTAMQTLQKGFAVGDKVTASSSEGPRERGVVTGHGLHTVSVRLNGRREDTPFYPNELRACENVECGGDGCAAEEGNASVGGREETDKEPDEDGGIWGPFEIDDLVFFAGTGRHPT